MPRNHPIRRRRDPVWLAWPFPRGVWFWTHEPIMAAARQRPWLMGLRHFSACEPMHGFDRHLGYDEGEFHESDATAFQAWPDPWWMDVGLAPPRRRRDGSRCARLSKGHGP